MVLVRSFEAPNYSNVMKMIDNYYHRQGAFAVAGLLPRWMLAWIIHEDSVSRVNSVKKVVRSPEKCVPPCAEGDEL